MNVLSKFRPNYKTATLADLFFHMTNNTIENKKKKPKTMHYYILLVK